MGKETGKNICPYTLNMHSVLHTCCVLGICRNIEDKHNSLRHVPV